MPLALLSCYARKNTMQIIYYAIKNAKKFHCIQIVKFLSIVFVYNLDEKFIFQFES